MSLGVAADKTSVRLNLVAAWREATVFTEAERAALELAEAGTRTAGSATRPMSTKAFLSATVTRIAIDVLRSARVRREECVGPWFPEPLLNDPYQDPARSVELADSVSMAALLLLLERLFSGLIGVPLGVRLRQRINP